MNRDTLCQSLKASEAFYERVFMPVLMPREQLREEAKQTIIHIYQEMAQFEARLVMAEAGLGHKYSPDQPRDDHGRWTSGGGEDESVVAPTGDAGNAISNNPGSSRFDNGALNDEDDGDDDSNNGVTFPGSGTVMDDSGNIYQLPNYSDQTVPDTWANPDMGNFEDHWEDHGADFDAQSPEDYANQANQFYNIAQEEKLPSIEYPNGGEIGIYDPESNTFGVYTPDGKTITFYQPTSPNYFQGQIDKATAGGGRIIEPLPIE